MDHLADLPTTQLFTIRTDDSEPPPPHALISSIHTCTGSSGTVMANLRLANEQSC
jgi:hypothetical protein